MQTETDLTKAVDPTAGTKKPKGEDYATAREQFSMFMRAYDSGHREYLDLKKKCNDYYMGEQWDAKDLSKLNAEGRPALTINMILSTVNIVLGEQIGRRVDISYKPAKDAAQDSAVALTKLAMAIADANQLHWKETQVFSDGLIEERGYYDVRMNFDDNISGECEISTVDGGDIIPDPDSSSYDPSDWKEFYRARWLSLDEIEDNYGKPARTSLEGVTSEEDGDFGKESIRRLKNTFGDTDEKTVEGWADATDEETRGFVIKVRVIERQFYKNTTVYSLIDPATGVKRDLPPETTKENAEKLASHFKASIQKSTKPRVRWRITADQFVLYDEWSIYKTFSIIPYFAYFRRGKPFGMVRNLLSPQEQYNKLSSQELHIVNTTANSGYIVEVGALHGMTADDLKESGSKTGTVITVNPGRMGGIEKIKPNTIPTGIDRISSKSAQNLKEISGINDAMLGQEGAEVSGVALDKKEKRGQVQIQVPLDNLSRTRHMLARKILELVQDFYTDERIVHYVNDMATSQETDEFSINQVQPDGSIINDVTKGSYNIVIGTLPARDNFRDTQFAEALNLRNVGINIPGYRVVQYSNLAHKQEVAEEVKQLDGMGEPSPEQAEMQNRQMEAQIRDLEAEVEKKLAAASELMSRVELNEAKTDETLASPELQQRGLEYKDVADKRGIDLREKLGTLQALNKLDVTELTSRLKGSKDEGRAIE